MERVYFFKSGARTGYFPKENLWGLQVWDLDGPDVQPTASMQWGTCSCSSNLNDCEVNLSQAVWFLVRGHGSTLAKQSVMSCPQVLRVWSVVTYEVILLNTRSKLLTFTTEINSRYNNNYRYCYYSPPLSILKAIFPGEPGLVIFIGTKDDESKCNRVSLLSVCLFS